MIIVGGPLRGRRGNKIQKYKNTKQNKKLEMRVRTDLRYSIIIDFPASCAFAIHCLEGISFRIVNQPFKIKYIKGTLSILHIFGYTSAGILLSLGFEHELN